MLKSRVQVICIGDILVHAWTILGNYSFTEGQRIRLYKESRVPYIFYEVRDCETVEELCGTIRFDVVILAPKPELYGINETIIGTEAYNRRYNEYLERLLSEYEDVRRKLETIGCFPSKSIFLERSYLDSKRREMVEKHNFNCVILRGKDQIKLLDTALAMLK